MNGVTRFWQELDHCFTPCPWSRYASPRIAAAAAEAGFDEHLVEQAGSRAETPRR
jgi:hypothetical protein